MVDVETEGIRCRILNNETHDMILEDDHIIYGIVVPKGFIFDGASHIDELNNVRCASLLHDYLYRNINHSYDRQCVDNMFLRLMKKYGVSKYVRDKVYIGVRLFGGFIWKHYRITKKEGR